MSSPRIICLTSVLAIVIGLAANAPLVGQTIRGIAVAAGTTEPISGALVELVAEDTGAAPSDVRLDATIADETGAFALTAPRQGAYRVRLQRIGFATWTSDRIEVDAGGATVRLEVPIAPIPLLDLVAFGARTCGGKVDELLRAYELYDDAVRALEPVVWTEHAGLYVFEVELSREGPRTFPAGTPVKPEHYEAYDRWLRTGKIMAPAGDQEAFLRFLEITYPTPADTIRVRRPIETLASDELSQHGYIQATDPELVYFTPTAATFTSAEFRESHCFEITENDDGWVGLRFEPLRDNESPDVEGVIWLSPDRREPKRLEFEFTQLREMLREYQVPQIRAALRERLDVEFGSAYRLSFGSTRMRGDFGGQLEFERLADGTAITRRWELRLPLVWYYMTSSVDRPEFNAFPVALEMIRRGLVTAVLAPRDVADTVGSPEEGKLIHRLAGEVGKPDPVLRLSARDPESHVHEERNRGPERAAQEANEE